MGSADQRRVERRARLTRALAGVNGCEAHSNAAIDMYESKWWKQVPKYEEPKPVSGEIQWK